jgi:hypothetical protein
MRGPAGVAGIINSERRALDPRIHVFLRRRWKKAVDGRDSRFQRGQAMTGRGRCRATSAGITKGDGETNVPQFNRFLL